MFYFTALLVSFSSPIMPAPLLEPKSSDMSSSTTISSSLPNHTSTSTTKAAFPSSGITYAQLAKQSFLKPDPVVASSETSSQNRTKSSNPASSQTAKGITLENTQQLPNLPNKESKTSLSHDDSTKPLINGSAANNTSNVESTTDSLDNHHDQSTPVESQLAPAAETSNHEDNTISKTVSTKQNDEAEGNYKITLYIFSFLSSPAFIVT